MFWKRSTRSARAGDGCFQMGLEQRQHPGYGGQHGDALAVDGFNEPLCHQAIFKVQLGGEDGRNPQTHGLAEDVAQRQRVQNAQGMDQPLVAKIGLRAVLDGPHAGQHVAVGDHDAFGIAGGAGGEENFAAGFRARALQFGRLLQRARR